MKSSIIAAMLAGCLCSSSIAHSQTGSPIVQLCLVAYSAGAQEARYRVTIDWNGMAPGRDYRIDIGAQDQAGAIWPQLRDQRLRPGSRPAIEYITVSDVSRYPLRFLLLGFTRAAADTFDADCRNGFCSVRSSTEGVTEFAEGQNLGMTVQSVAQATRCRPAG